MIFTGKTITVKWDDEKVVELVPDGAAKGFHDWSDGGRLTHLLEFPIRSQGTGTHSNSTYIVHNSTVGRTPALPRLSISLLYSALHTQRLYALPLLASYSLPPLSIATRRVPLLRSISLCRLFIIHRLSQIVRRVHHPQWSSLFDSIFALTKL